MKDRQARQRRGFTLVEILLASMVGALVAAAGAGALRATVRSREKVERRLEVFRSLRQAAEQVRRDLGNLHRAGSARDQKFVGSSDERGGMVRSRIVFYAVSGSKARQDKPEADVYEVEYFLEECEGRRVLFRRQWPNPSEEEKSAGVVTMVAEHIVGFEVRYQDGEDWATAWPEEMERLPGLMLVTLVSGQDEGGMDMAEERFFVYGARREGQQGSGTGEGAQGAGGDKDKGAGGEKGTGGSQGEGRGNEGGGASDAGRGRS